MACVAARDSKGDSSAASRPTADRPAKVKEGRGSIEPRPFFGEIAYFGRTAPLKASPAGAPVVGLPSSRLLP
jgi:hypothetical protein